ncbi:SusC/RagA family TonB-linked outer membrane protein [Pedobacter caeni]|uniref:TonB-linked outer membrane protein, SusC/RagA family n=1 Tax=Pedobacter caeni TaxID=288992 RepID=A0A1M5LAB3_9SPHI|nr:SusC/RagA family TonB-linked outer membrane protein [Pedobacter caeni]SHG61948.1 TonB-linked outer membrane protein, SusC/RagA family [Pedobacter caeni]
MEMRKPLQLTCLLLYASANLFAGVKSDKLKSFPTLRISSYSEMGFRSPFQEVIKGTVKDDAGVTIPGVSIKVKGSQLATQTNTSGQYAIQAKAGDVLVFSYVGYAVKEVTVGGQSTIDVVLNSNSQNLETVVVTALGIKKSSRATTYATQQVDGTELTKSKETNLVNSLNGKVAGLTISRSSSGVGGSAKVILRGSKSAAGSNQALYVIDGVPMNNNTSGEPMSNTGGASTGQPNSAFGGSNSYDGGDPISNLNPEDIASISILKGASAAALYGSQAANGVIIVTTKSGEAGKAKVNFSSSFSLDEAAYTPEFQSNYGQSTAGAAQSWGPAVSGPSNNKKAYFQTGKNWTNSISLSAGSEKLQTYFSYANTNATGIQPKNELSRHNVNLKETGSFFDDKLTVTGNVNYVKQQINNTPNPGLYFNPLTGLYLFPSGLDLNSYKTGFEVFDPARNLNTQNWPFKDDIQQNPWWIANRNQNVLNRDRLMLSVSAKYKVNPWLDVQARGSMDNYTDKYEHRLYAGTSTVLTGANGGLNFRNNTSKQQYADVIANINVPLERFKISGTIGSSIQDFNDQGTIFNSGSTGLNIPNKFSIQNFAVFDPLSSGNSAKHKQLRSVFASASFAFDNWINLDLTARNDWSSALAFTNNMSFFYPSAGINFIINEKLKLPEWVSFAKIRGSYAEVGNDVPEYVTNIMNSYGAGGAVNTPTASSFNTLKPENTKSIELGTEWRFLNNRLNFDFTYYKTNTKNQFLIANASQVSLFDKYYFNAGDIQNQGVEVILGYDVLGESELKWKTGINYSMNKNKVLKLATNITEFTLSGSSGASFVSKFKEGGSYGDIYGSSLQYDGQGRVMIDAGGNPIVKEGGNATFLGNANPKWQLGWNNSFNYKDFSLSFLFDGKFGGKVMSVTESTMEGYGVAKVTGTARDQGGVSVNGVDPSGNPVSKVDAAKWYNKVGGRDGVSSEHMYNATVVRLRELSFGYTVPMKQGFIKSLKLSLTGRNLFYVYKKAPFDPELSMSTSNGLSGVDVFMPPATRNYGFSLNANF